MTPFDRSHTSSYWRCVATMALSCIISEIRPDVGQKSRFSPAFDEGPGGNIAIMFGKEKLEWYGCLMVKMFDDIFSRFDTIPACDRRTDSWTDIVQQHSTRYREVNSYRVSSNCMFVNLVVV